MKYDIVYVVKETDENPELTYSLRSLKNFPHNKVWFYGGCPKNLKPDAHVPQRQISLTKYSNVSNMLQEICKNKEITESFWLFNDDFFILRKLDSHYMELLEKGFHNGSLQAQIERCEEVTDGVNGYTRKLRRTLEWLEENNYPTRNYEMHIPMLFNRKKLSKIFEKTYHCSRSKYGNIYLEHNINTPDVKIFSCECQPTQKDLLSTSDESFKDGKAGKFIRNTFKEKSKYETLL